jgi:hypothetical protein
MTYFSTTAISLPDIFSNLPKAVSKQSIISDKFSILILYDTFFTPFQHVDYSFLNKYLILVREFLVHDYRHNQLYKEYFLKVTVTLNKVVFEKHCTHLLCSFLIINQCLHSMSGSLKIILKFSNDEGFRQISFSC